MSLSRSGPVGRGGGIGGLLLHAVLAVDASTGALLGPVDVTVRNRTGPRPRTPVHCCPGSPRHRVPQPSRRSAPPRSTPSRRRSRPRCTENARTGLAGPDGLPPADGCTILAARPVQLAAEPPFLQATIAKLSQPNCIANPCHRRPPANQQASRNQPSSLEAIEMCAYDSRCRGARVQTEFTARGEAISMERIS